MNLDGPPEPQLHEIDLGLWCRNPTLRFLLKDMKHVHSALQFHGIHGAIRVAAMIGNNLQDSLADVPQRFCLDVLAAQLRMKESRANFIFHFLRKSPYCLERIRDPDQRFRYEAWRSLSSK